MTNYLPDFKSILNKYKVSMDNLIFIDDTASQLETVLKVSELICTESINEAICFANIDTPLQKVNFSMTFQN